MKSKFGDKMPLQGVIYQKFPFLGLTVLHEKSVFFKYIGINLRVYLIKLSFNLILGITDF